MDRIAAIHRIEQRQLIAMLADHRGDFLHDARALERRHAPPGGEAGFAGGDGGLGISASATGATPRLAPLAGSSTGANPPAFGSCQAPPQ